MGKLQTGKPLFPGKVGQRCQPHRRTGRDLAALTPALPEFRRRKVQHNAVVALVGRQQV